MLKTITLLIFAFVSLTFSTIVSIQDWNANKAYQNQDIVIYQYEAYLATQNISAGNIPDKSNAWKKIKDYSNPKNYKHDSAYVAGDIAKYNNEIYVARHWSSYTYPNKNDQWGAWILVENYTPIVPKPSGPLAKLPPDPGAEGKKTVLGIDSDGDGVRDDIQIAVTKLIPDDPYARAGAMFMFAMEQELWNIYLKNPDESFEFYQPYFIGCNAGSWYNIKTGAFDLISYDNRAIMLYNTMDRFLTSRKLDDIANGQAFQTYDYYPEYKEKYDNMFQEFYEREKERQK